MFEIGTVVLEKIFHNRQCIFVICNYLPLEKSAALHLNKLESRSPKNGLCQYWLKLAQLFWGRRWKCEKFTDRQTDDRRKVIRKAHLSFQLRWKLRWANKTSKMKSAHLPHNLAYQDENLIKILILCSLMHFTKWLIFRLSEWCPRV